MPYVGTCVKTNLSDRRQGQLGPGSGYDPRSFLPVFSPVKAPVVEFSIDPDPVRFVSSLGGSDW